MEVQASAEPVLNLALLTEACRGFLVQPTPQVGGATITITRLKPP